MPKEDKSPGSTLKQYTQPRFLMMVWGGLGLVFLAVILFGAMIPKGKPGSERPASQNYVVGEMANFTPAFPPRGAPQVPFNAPDGAEMTLSDFRGQVILVNLWATWCAPCLEELPSLDTLNAQLGGEDFQVVAIAAEPRVEERGQQFFDRLGIETLELYADPMLSLATSMGGSDVLPVSILYDRRGREVGRLVGGADWAGEDARALIEAVIAGETIS